MNKCLKIKNPSIGILKELFKPPTHSINPKVIRLDLLWERWFTKKIIEL